VARALAAVALDGHGVSREPTSLRRLVGRSVGWSTLDAVVGRLGQFLIGLVIARIVAPREFGVFAIALVVHAVVVNISELGVTAVLIRDDPERTARSAPTVATISLLSGVLLAILVAALAPVFASGLGSSRATTAIVVMSLNLPLAGITAVPSALLRRGFRMDRIFYADIANLVTSSVVVVVLALAGWGALALAWSWVAGQICSALLLLSYRAGRFWPGWDKAEAGRLLAGGLPLAGASLLWFLVLNVDNIVVGRVLGAEALGLYVLAFNIASWPATIFGAVIRSVSLPGFSRQRLDGVAMPASFLGALRLVVRLTLPICLIIGALAHPLVAALYGPRWSLAAGPLIGLSIMGAGRIVLELSGDYLTALGRGWVLLLAGAMWVASLTIVLILVARRHGINGVGAGQAFVVLAIMVPFYGMLLHRAGVRVHLALRAFVPALFWALAAAAAAHTLATGISNPFLACAAGGTVGMAIASATYWRTIGSRASSFLRDRRVSAVNQPA
jgi:O-antigen/teichoic acid export membrane protein